MRTHPLNVTYLVLGLSFLGIAGSWALTEAGVVDARAGWVLPLVLVVAGGVGLVASLARGLHRTQPHASSPRPPEAPADQPADQPGDEPDDEPDDEVDTRLLDGR